MVSIPVEIATKYVRFGIFLLEDRNGSRVKIMAHKYLYNPVQINTEILNEWLTGRGKQPVTWATLIEVLHDIELSTLAGDIMNSKLIGEVMQGDGSRHYESVGSLSLFKHVVTICDPQHELPIYHKR